MVMNIHFLYEVGRQYQDACDTKTILLFEQEAMA